MKKVTRAFRKIRYLVEGADKERVTEFRGARFYARCDDHIGKRLLLDGGYEAEELDYLLAQAGQHRFEVFLDLGACFGLYSQVLAANTEIKTFHAFELDPKNAELFSRTCELNAMTSRIRLWPMGLGAEAATIPCCRQQSCVGNSRVISGDVVTAEQEGYETFTAQIVALDDVLEFADQQLLIKMDVECQELAVLKGMKRMLQSNQALLQIEVFNANLPDVDAFLSDLGYRNIHKVHANHYYTNL